MDGREHHATIRKVPIFAGLGDEECDELWEAATRVAVAPGETLIREGDEGDTVYIVLSGALEVTKRDGNRDVTLATRMPGEVLGEMSLIERAPRTASVRAVEPSELLAIGPAAFRRLLERRPETAATLLRTIAGRLRSTEASLVQSDKLAALGTLAAGLAHELNNPAAAIQRSSGYLGEAFEAWRRRTVELSMLALSAAERQNIGKLEEAISGCSAARQDEAAARRQEGKLGDRLDELGVSGAFDLAPAMAIYGWTVERVDALAGDFAGEHVVPVLQWLGSGLEAQQLMEEIKRAAGAISGIVRAVKSYAYLDQAPVQDVDLRASLDDTLMILNHKIKHGIEVVKDFPLDLPRVEAYAGELNQVWTNLIDNAIQAMDGNGRLELAARGLGKEVEVRIADSGSGIPPDAAPHIFEPFFTTKAQGIGTGLGLHIARNIIVDRHRGRISFETRPGRTEFRIVLPTQLGDGRSSDSGQSVRRR